MLWNDITKKQLCLLTFKGKCTTPQTKLFLWILSFHLWGTRFGPTKSASGLPSLPLKNLVADSNNKLQSDRSIVDQLEPLKSLRMSGWGGKKINLQFTSG